MTLELGLKANVKCPKCNTSPTVTTGLWCGFVIAELMSRLEKEGGTVTCPHCRHRYEVEGEKEKKRKQRKQFFKKLFSR